jgi:hypothetical protein
MSSGAVPPLTSPAIAFSSPLSEPPPSLLSPSPGRYNTLSPLRNRGASPIRAETTYDDDDDDEDDDDEDGDAGANGDIYDDDDDDDGASATRVFLTRQEKLDVVVQTLREISWSFEELIETWVGIRGHADLRVAHQRYHNQKQRQDAMTRALRTLAQHNICQKESDVTRCAQELDRLVKESPFSMFRLDMNLEQLDFAQGVAVIERTAPTWYVLLQTLLGNRRQGRPTYTTHKKWVAVHWRMFTVTSMVCFSRARHNSNTLSSCLDVYLLGSGVHRRVIETLAGLGLCHSYHHANSLMTKVAEHASVRSNLLPPM